MTIEIHGMPGSAPCRIAHMTANTLGLDYKYILCDLMKRDNFKEDYLKINPQHTVPTLVDDGFVVNESRPIATYLCDNHGGETGAKLYPKDPKVRAIVDARLYFDIGTFYKAFGDIVYPILFGQTVEPAALANYEKRFGEVMAWVTDFLAPTGYVAGTDHMTVADLAFVATYSTIEAVGHFDLTPFPEIKAWFEKVKAEIPDYEEVNGKGAADMGKWYKTAKSGKTF